MKSSEQQPTLEPEESPEDVELNIDEAKKFLEEAYGPEKNSIDTEQIRAQEIKKAEETKENLITTAEKTEIKPTAETEEKSRQERKEKAFQFLSDPKVIEQNPREIVKSFRNLTENEKGEHRHLAKERNELAYKNLKERGCVILIGKEAIEKARQRIMEKEQEKIKNKEHSMAIETFWERNSHVKEENREKYLSDVKKRLGLDGVDGDIAFDHLVNSGYLVEKSKMGWLTDKKIPKIDGKLALIFENKKDLLRQIVQEANSKISAEAKINTDLKFIAGKKRIIREKQVCAKEIIEKTVAEYEAEKKLKEAPKPPETETPSNEGKKEIPAETALRPERERTPEQMREIKKIKRQLMADIMADKKRKADIEERKESKRRNRRNN